jgi:hypothetical protein
MARCGLVFLVCVCLGSANGVRAESGAYCAAEPGDSGELRVGDHADWVRREGESAEV